MIQIPVLNGVLPAHVPVQLHADMEAVPAPKDPSGHVLGAAAHILATLTILASQAVLMNAHIPDKPNALEML